MDINIKFDKEVEILKISCLGGVNVLEKYYINEAKIFPSMNDNDLQQMFDNNVRKQYLLQYMLNFEDNSKLIKKTIVYGKDLLYSNSVKNVKGEPVYKKKSLKQLKQERDEGVMKIVEKLYDKSSDGKFVFYTSHRECGGWVINFGEKWDAMSEEKRKEIENVAIMEIYN